MATCCPLPLILIPVVWMSVDTRRNPSVDMVVAVRLSRTKVNDQVLIGSAVDGGITCEED
jgi:hypothetical protein